MPRPEHTQKNSNLFADEGKDRCAEGEDADQHGKERHREEGIQPKEQKEQNRAPTSNCLRHNHFIFSFGEKVIGRIAKLIKITPVQISSCATNNFIF